MKFKEAEKWKEILLDNGFEVDENLGELYLELESLNLGDIIIWAELKDESKDYHKLKFYFEDVKTDLDYVTVDEEKYREYYDWELMLQFLYMEAEDNFLLVNADFDLNLCKIEEIGIVSTLLFMSLDDESCLAAEEKLINAFLPEVLENIKKEFNSEVINND